MKVDKYGAHPQTEQELTDYLRTITDAQHDYNTSAEGLRDGTVACFNYLAHRLGNSGFQASYAALSLVGIVNGYDGPFGIIKAEDQLYPQYDPPEVKAREFAEGWQDWVRDQAKAKLAEFPDGVVVNERVDEETGERYEMPNVSPRVFEHWKELAGV